MYSGLLYEKKITDEIFLKNKGDNVISAVLESFKKKVLIINTDNEIVYINKKTNDLFVTNDYIGKNLFSVLEINKNYIKKCLLDGCAFSSLKVIIKDKVLYADLTPLVFNSQTIGGLIILKEKEDSFIETFKLSNNINKEIELFYSMYYDEVMVTDEHGKIICINNPICAKYYSLSKDDLLNLNVKELQKKGVFKPSVTLKVLREKRHVSILQKTQTGEVLMVYGIPVFDSDFKLSKIFSTSKNFTEVYQLKEKLNKTEKLMKKYHLKLKELKLEQSLLEGVIHKSPQMKVLIDLIKRISVVDSNVVLGGESGVGKGLFAKLIHSFSDRKNSEFVSINCGTIPEALFESEFFGYEKGAFTGARSEGKTGYLELANNGTLFLDEISELPLAMQVKLLKVIDEKSFARLGGTRTITSNFRLIVATNKDLTTLIKESKFREDLFYRLNVIQISIPPLRERQEDIPLLINFFLDKYNKKYNKDKKLEPSIYDLLIQYDWPGNIRELENLIERLIVTIKKQLIKVTDLPVFPIKDILLPENLRLSGSYSLKNAIENLEKQYILDAYKKYKSTYKVSEILSISQPSVVRKLKKYRTNIE